MIYRLIYYEQKKYYTGGFVQMDMYKHINLYQKPV